MSARLTFGLALGGQAAALESGSGRGTDQHVIVGDPDSRDRHSPVAEPRLPLRLTRGAWQYVPSLFTWLLACQPG